MGAFRRLSAVERAEICLDLIQRQLDAWEEVDAYAGSGESHPLDVMALLVSFRLQQILRDAEYGTDEVYWDRLMAMDAPVPIVLVASMDEPLWTGLNRDDFESLFGALRDQGWAPLQWGEGFQN